MQMLLTRSRKILARIDQIGGILLGGDTFVPISLFSQWIYT